MRMHTRVGMVVDWHGLARCGSMLLVLLCGCDAGCPRLQSCDIRERSCQREIAEVAACLRGGEVVTPAVEVVDADAFIEGELAAAAAAEPPTVQQRAMERALSLLELAPESSDPAAVTRESWDGVAAFYAPDTGGVTVLDRGDDLNGSSAVVTLLHELVHAMQKLGEPEPEASFDASLARRAMIEGEATLYQDLALSWALGWDPDDVDWALAFWEFRNDAWDRARRSDVPLYMAGRHFSYAFGGSYLNQAWRTGGNAAVRAVLADPPRSTRQILAGHAAAPEAFGGVWYESPDDLGEPQMPAEYERVGVSHLGAWAVEAFVDRLERADEVDARDEGGPPARREGPLGDVLVVYRNTEDGRVVLTWRFRFAPGAEGAAGQWVALLTQGPGAVLQQGRDVVLMRSSDAQLPARLLPQLGWGPVESESESGEASQDDMSRQLLHRMGASFEL